MLELDSTIARIRALLDDESEASVTYAALEARLALERVCYDRLRQRHDYISHAQLQRWQPGAVINTLMAEVDPHLGHTVVLSMSKGSDDGDLKPEEHEYVEIGTEVGLNSKRIAKLWNALGKLALHAHLPENKEDQLGEYGDATKIRLKVDEVVLELERLAKGTMSFSGFVIGGDVVFECTCGEINRRRASLLLDGQFVHCYNPECRTTWKAIKEPDGFGFESVTVSVSCENCLNENHLPWRYFIDMKYDQYGSFSCHSCQHKNYVQWRLMQVRPQSVEQKKYE